MRGGEGLARSGDAEQHLVALAILDSLDQLLDRGRLVAGGRELGLQPEFRRRARARDDHLADGCAGSGLAGGRGVGCRGRVFHGCKIGGDRGRGKGAGRRCAGRVIGSSAVNRIFTGTGVGRR